MRAVSNPPNPWSSTHVEWLGEPPTARLQVFEEEARTIISENDSPDLGFRFSVNPYRGCQHACAYCYARPTHQYLGFGAGTDFEEKVVVKTNAAQCLRNELSRASWKRETIVFSGVTDCYQPLEASYGLTRACLEVCRDLRNPVSIITKGALIRRDVDLLAQMARIDCASVYLSIPFADEKIGRKIEPRTSSPSQRFETLRLLSEAGIPTGIGIAPLIPGLNDRDIPTLLERAHHSGASSAFMVLLRLPAEVLPVFEERLAEAFPLRTEKIWSAVRELRGGKLNESAFGKRFRGQGPRWKAIRDLFEIHCRRLNLSRGGSGGSSAGEEFRRGSEG